jgi:hypothetical protein
MVAWAYCIDTIRETALNKSIYRGWRDLPSDIQVIDRADGASSDHRETPAPIHLRRLQPATTLFPRTRQWIASLPEPVRPNVLAAQFARIANTICVVWGDPKQCREYFDELLMHRRAGRKGFPAAVQREITRLHDFYTGMHDAYDRSRR